MKKLKKLVVLNKGQKDDLNLMDKQAMNLIRGGLNVRKIYCRLLWLWIYRTIPINVTNENKRVVMMQLYGSLVC